MSSARAFADRVAARAYFASSKWDLDEAEYLFLERAAAAGPGRFPEELGADYTGRGEQFLVERSQRLEQAGNTGGRWRA